MSATVWGNEVKYTKRFLLGRLLSEITENYLLLTATPHNGKEKDFQLFLSLIDRDRFEGAARYVNQNADISDVMRRLVKEELLKFDGTPLFPERLAYTVNYDLSSAESELYNAVTKYVQEEFNRADKLEGGHRTTVGFALTILQRRLASSPEAIYQSLRRRRERLERRFSEVASGSAVQECAADDIPDDFDEDDYSSAELEQEEENVVDQSTAARTAEELAAEITTLYHLEDMANSVRVSGDDRKWDELSKLIQDEKNMFGFDGVREKLIIFTEHRDTLRYLTEKIISLLGDDRAVVNIHGGMTRDERHRAEALFKQDSEVRFLIATDAAGEGINLQRAHLMVNYDLPWNPNRLEQRFGRIHRIGQTEVCHLWNLVSKETREGMVFQRLFEKLEQERAALGGKVFDILGKVTFDNMPLRDLLIQAVRYGSDPAVRARLATAVDNSLDRENLEAILRERALTEDVFDVHTVTEVREEMERRQAHRLQPHFIEAFFLEAFRSLGGRINPREKGRYEIAYVPYVLKGRDTEADKGQILSRYERVCFDKKYCAVPGTAPAELICPGSPLMDAVTGLILKRGSKVLKLGTVLIDEQDYSNEPRLLFYIEDTITDDVTLKNGEKRVISKSVHFVELYEDGRARNAGYAPYLDYRAPTEEELLILKKFIASQRWLNSDVEELASDYAVFEMLPRHCATVKKRRLAQINKIEQAVKTRLSSEINYWDARSWELKEAEARGKINTKLNSQNAAKRADELAERRDRRLEELGAEKRMASLVPAVVGGALIIPRGLLCGLTGQAQAFSLRDRQAVEFAAMRAVMEIERSLGYEPHDVSEQNVGYDIESSVPEGTREGSGKLRFIEVKGRVAGADTVTVSRNEILTALSAPENFILALVIVDGGKTETTYLTEPFLNRPDDTAAGVSYHIDDLEKYAKVIYKEQE